MLPFEPERVEKNARAATTEDLLERVTVYREGMEPEALEIIEAELRCRGVSWQEVADHDQRLRRDALMDESGIALRCNFCNSPAVDIRWGWHWLWGRVPVFPRKLRYCREHLAADDE
jgi:hypothetical protein